MDISFSNLGFLDFPGLVPLSRVRVVNFGQLGFCRTLVLGDCVCESPVVVKDQEKLGSW